MPFSGWNASCVMRGDLFAATALVLRRPACDRQSMCGVVLMDHECKDSQEVGLHEARYANYFKVGHNVVEFLLDFGQFYPESEKAQLHTRIVTSPIYAKALLEIISESLDRYEQTFGAIPKEDKEGA